VLAKGYCLLGRPAPLSLVLQFLVPLLVLLLPALTGMQQRRQLLLPLQNPLAQLMLAAAPQQQQQGEPQPALLLLELLLHALLVLHLHPCLLLIALRQQRRLQVQLQAQLPPQQQQHQHLLLASQRLLVRPLLLSQPQQLALLQHQLLHQPHHLLQVLHPQQQVNFEAALRPQ
jgi:hypothetical protein